MIRPFATLVSRVPTSDVPIAAPFLGATAPPHARLRPRSNRSAGMSDTRSARAELEALLRDELWESAELFGGFLVASTSADGDATPPGERAACVALFADALLGKGEHRRALQHYRRALQLNGLASVAAADADASTPDARR